LLAVQQDARFRLETTIPAAKCGQSLHSMHEINRNWLTPPAGASNFGRVLRLVQEILRRQLRPH